MVEYVIVCIGTNKLVVDSFGPRVGQKLQATLKKYPKIQVLGTMKNPVHFKNAQNVLETLNCNKQIILVDSAFGVEESIGTTYFATGGIEIGKAYGKSFYFPAHINIKTVIGNKNKIVYWNIEKIDLLAQKVANEITQVMQNVYI